MSDHVCIPASTYQCLIRIAFLTSDNIMAERDCNFKNTMRVNIDENRKELERLVDIFEATP